VKILVIGDSHGNIANLKHVMGFAKKVKVGAVIHTGDWNNLKSVDEVLSFRIPLYTVLGNADVDPNFDLKDFLEFEIDGKKIYLVHRLLKKDTRYIGKDIVFTGHYHSQKIWEQDGVKIVRPGALEKDINFAIYDTKTNKVELFHE
jgi:putative phosphoesterase